MLNSFKKKAYRFIFRPQKYSSELNYWKTRFKEEKGHFYNDHYRTLMLAMADKTNDDFLDDKIVADFGCGPRGSLSWADRAKMRIGIDVLADVYMEHFADELLQHNMVYLKCSESCIPMPDESVDVLFTMNAFDHVDNLAVMARELLRILRPGGELIASFNLNEPPSTTEPQRLTETVIHDMLLRRLKVRHQRCANRGPAQNAYQYFFEEHGYNPNQPGFLWVSAVKK